MAVISSVSVKAMPQSEGTSMVLDESSFRAEQTDPLGGINIDPIAKDRSNRACFRLKLHLNRMTPDDIAKISIEPVGGNIVLMRKETAKGGNGIIVEMTARPEVRFYIKHPTLGNSNVVTVNPEADQVYVMNGWADQRLTVALFCAKAGAEVWLDGAFRGTIGSDNTINIPDVSPGTHSVKVISGDNVAEQQIEVSSSKVFFNVEFRNAALSQQFLMFKVTPEDALIMLDGEPLLVTEGSASKLVKFGVHNYTISAKDYYKESGEVIVNDLKQKKIVNIDLKPAFGWLNISSASSAGAHVYVGDDMIGQAPIQGYQLTSGTYQVKIIKQMYKSYDAEITVTDGNTTDINPVLLPDFTELRLSVDNNAEIWMNGEHKGNGFWSGRVMAGTYNMETRKSGHRPVSEYVVVRSDSPVQSLTLQAPTPIYGSLSLTSNPEESEVYIDGAYFGQTPLYLPQVLIGSHSVQLRKSGKSDWTGGVIIEEDKMSEVTAVLEGGTSGTQSPDLKKRDVNFSDHKTISHENLPVFDMIMVEGGTFSMGATPEQADDAAEDEKPVHRVTLSDYYIGETEVTQQLWKAVMDSNPSRFPGDDRPVENVSWNDCQKFIKKLNSMTGMKFRLPTEAEWEYAARGGRHSAKTIYSGSNNIDEVAWNKGNSSKMTHEVKTRKPNELGIYDMSGNVWEWCNDIYGKYSSASQTNPSVEGASSSSHILRGGNYSYNKSSCRVSYRYFNTVLNRTDACGFRLVLEK